MDTLRFAKIWFFCHILKNLPFGKIFICVIYPPHLTQGEIMKFLSLIAVLAFSFATHASDKSACIAKYDLLQDSTTGIFYYEIAKYNNDSGKFESLKQWYCEDAEVAEELPKMLKDNCTIINIDGVAIQPNLKGAFDVTFGCG